MKTVLVFCVRCYQVLLSPILHKVAGPAAGCRYWPTCSQYFIEAVRIHGAVRGSWLGIKRICRCAPWGSNGYDPVPPRRERSGTGGTEAAPGKCGCGGSNSGVDGPPPNS